MTAAEIVCLLGYASLGLELVFLAVPSVVSTRQLWMERSQVRGRLVRLGLPAAACVLAWLLPPLVILIPRVEAWLVPLEPLRLPAVAWAGGGLVVLGRCLTLAAVLELRRSALGGELATRGVFAWSRHPGLVGMFAFALGCVLVVPCLVVAVGLALYAVRMHAKALLEEAHLVRVWGEGYRDYAARVARYLVV